MGIGLRIFLVNDDGSLHRLSVARYERLLRRDPKERLPRYAGKRLRYALIVCEVEKRKPLEILRIEYSWLCLDSEGRIDAAEQEREQRLAVEVLPPVLMEEQPQQVIDAKHRFAEKRYKDRYTWTPGVQLEAAIVRAVFD